MSERKFMKDKICTDNICGQFEAELYPGCPPLDTSIKLDVHDFAITWRDREKLIKELQEVIEKYKI